VTTTCSGRLCAPPLTSGVEASANQNSARKEHDTPVTVPTPDQL
jgi:hypothetical protein